MKEFDVQDESIMVKGMLLTAFLQAFGAYKSRGERVLKRHLGGESIEINENELYPCSKVLAGFRELQDQFGPDFIQRVGQFLYENVPFPEELDSFEATLAGMNPVYYGTHANAEGKIGHYRFEKTGPKSGLMVCDNPYPCAFDMGILLGVAKSFGEEATITHEKEEPCRRDGGERCTYRIEW